MDKFFPLYKKILWSGWWLLLAWLFYNLLVPSGQITYVWHPGPDSNRVSRLTPEERVDLPAAGAQRLRGTPVYWLVNTSRIFSHLSVTVEYEPGKEDNLELGLLRDGKLWRYERKSVYNRYLEQLLASGDWQVIVEGERLLAQRRPVYKSIAEFESRPPKAAETVAYNYRWQVPVKLSDYKPDSQLRSVNAGLIGSWTAYTYIKDEVLRLRLEAVDYNKDKYDDKGELFVWAPDGRQVASYQLADGRGGEEGGKAQAAGSLTVDLPGLAEGLYKLEWRAGRDLEVRDLATYQKTWSIVGKAEVARPLGLWLQGDTVSFSTSDPLSLGKVQVGSSTVAIDDTYKQFRSAVACGGACAVKVPGSTVLGTNGRLAFWPSGLVGPEVRELNEEAVKNKQINFIIANYRQPQLSSGRRIVTADFDLSGAYRQQGAYGLMLAMPEQVVEGPKIYSIRMSFQGLGWKTLWQKLWQK